MGILMEQSIGRSFSRHRSGLIVLSFLDIYGWAKINPAIAPLSTRSSWGVRMRSLPDIFWIAIVFLLVVGGIMRGYFTPTEAGAAGTFAVLLLSILQRNMTFKRYVTSVRESLRTAIMILMLVAGSTVLGHFITITNIPQSVAEWAVNLSVSRYVVMFIICVIYLIGGSFIDDLTFMILATPIFYPVALKLGFPPVVQDRHRRGRDGRRRHPLVAICVFVSRTSPTP